MTREAVLLIGAPGSGKTAIGLELASEYGYRFHDLEAELVQQYGSTDAFVRDKRNALSRLHSRVVDSLDAHLPPYVFETTALGDRPFVDRLMKERSVLAVCLNVSLNQALRRVAERPVGRNLSNDPGATERIWRACAAVYADLDFDLRIDTDEMEVPMIAKVIHKAVGSSTS